jgi:membrane-bound inhibitor of C-type lysozyme
MTKVHVAVVALSLSVLAGSMSNPILAEEPAQTLSRAIETETGSTRRVLFACPKNTLLTVEFVTSDPAKPAIVRPPGGAEITLPPQPSGSGFRYADETHELLGKGREVTWTEGSAPPVVCTEETPAVGGTEPK